MIMNVYALGITSMCIGLSVIEMLYPMYIDMQDGNVPPSTMHPRMDMRKLLNSY